MSARISLLLLGLALLGPLGHAGAQPLRKPLPLNACAGDLSNVPYWTKALKAPDPQLRVRSGKSTAADRPTSLDWVRDPPVH